MAFLYIKDFDNNRCKFCQTITSDFEAQRLHCTDSTHQKRKTLSQFVTKLSQNKPVQSRSSLIMERYSNVKESVLGADCIVELILPWQSSGFWICGICYEAGSNFDSLDYHIYSRRHIGIYLNEIREDSSVDAFTCSPDELLKMMQLVCQENAVNLPPDIFELKTTVNEFFPKIGFSKAQLRKHYSVVDTKYNKVIVVTCEICLEVMAWKKNDDKSNEKHWSEHTLSPDHRKALMISNIIGLCNTVTVHDDEAHCEQESFQWQEDKLLQRHVAELHGPVCGTSFLVHFDDFRVCLLCRCLVSSLEEHFSSESHICRFLVKHDPVNAIMMRQCSQDYRRKTILRYLNKHHLGNEQFLKCNSKMPEALVQILSKTSKPIFPFYCRVSLPDNSVKLFCPACQVCVPTKKAWDCEHVATLKHWKCLIEFDFHQEPQFRVPVASSVESELKQGLSLDGCWNGNDAHVCQNLMNIGLEFVYEDKASEQFCCIICSMKTPVSKKSEFIMHVRSYRHLHKFALIKNQRMISVINNAAKFNLALEACLSELQKSPSLFSEISDIPVYDSDFALRLQICSPVPKKFVDGYFLHDLKHDVFNCVYDMVDQISATEGSAPCVSMREALLKCNFRILEFSEHGNGDAEIVLKCMDCTMIIHSEASKIIELIWKKHATSESHINRKNAQFSPAVCHFLPQPSVYQVDPVVHTEGNKLAWRHIKENGCFHFVYEKVGLFDIIERRSLNVSAPLRPSEYDLYCTLCNCSIPLSKFSLENHVGTSEHVYEFVNKYATLELKSFKPSAALTDKEKRKILSQAVVQLKNVVPKGFVRVYDPYEQERHTNSEREERERTLKNQELSRSEAVKARLIADEQRRQQKKEEEEARAREKARRIELERARRLHQKELERVTVSKQIKAQEDAKTLQVARQKAEAEAHRLAQKAEKMRQLNATRKELEETLAKLKKLRQKREIEASVPPPSLVVPTPAEVSSAFIAPPSQFNRPKPVPPPPASRPFYTVPRTESWPTNMVQSSLANASVDSNVSTPGVIVDRDQLVDYMWRQGTSPIPPDELPVKFNEFVSKIEGAVGLSSIFEVVCLDDRALDTFYCSICSYWAFPIQMASHMTTVEHQSAYLYKYNKKYHNVSQTETIPNLRDALVANFASVIWNRNNHHEVVGNRLKTILSKSVFVRLWPTFENFLSDAWKDPSKTFTLSEPARRAEPYAPSTSPSPNEVLENYLKVKKDREARHNTETELNVETSKNQKESTKSKEKERKLPDQSRSRKRSRSRSRSPRQHRSTSKARSRARSNSRRRSRSTSRETKRSPLRPKPKLPINISSGNLIASEIPWEKKTEQFLRGIGAPTKLSTQPASTTHIPKLLISQNASTKDSLILPEQSTEVSGPPGVDVNDTAPPPKKAATLDAESIQRKLLGAVATATFDRDKFGGELSSEQLLKIYDEVGLSANDALKFQNIIQQFGKTSNAPAKKLNLEAFGIDLKTSASSQISSSTPTAPVARPVPQFPRSSMQSTPTNSFAAQPICTASQASSSSQGASNVFDIVAKLKSVRGSDFGLSKQNDELCPFVFPGRDAFEKQHVSGYDDIIIVKEVIKNPPKPGPQPHSIMNAQYQPQQPVSLARPAASVARSGWPVNMPRPTFTAPPYTPQNTSYPHSQRREFTATTKASQSVLFSGTPGQSLQYPSSTQCQPIKGTHSPFPSAETTEASQSSEKEMCRDFMVREYDPNFPHYYASGPNLTQGRDPRLPENHAADFVDDSNAPVYPILYPKNQRDPRLYQREGRHEEQSQGSQRSMHHYQGQSGYQGRYANF